MEHQKERRNELLPWPKDRPSKEWVYWIPRLKITKAQKIPDKHQRRDKNLRQQGEEKTGGRSRKKERKETRGESHKRHKRGMARHYFNFFALLLDVRSCPGLLP